MRRTTLRDQSVYGDIREGASHFGFCSPRRKLTLWDVQYKEGKSHFALCSLRSFTRKVIPGSSFELSFPTGISKEGAFYFTLWSLRGILKECATNFAFCSPARKMRQILHSVLPWGGGI
jgi:hypothetical protein